MNDIELREHMRRCGRAGRGQSKNRSAQMLKYWQEVRAGIRTHRGRGPAKPKQLVLKFEERRKK